MYIINAWSCGKLLLNLKDGDTRVTFKLDVDQTATSRQVSLARLLIGISLEI